MIPPLLTRPLSLQPPILNRHQIRIHALLVHGFAEQPAAIAGGGAQLLTRSRHGLVLALELELVCPALLGLVELPGAVDGPMTKVTGSGEAEGTGSERVPEEVADEH